MPQNAPENTPTTAPVIIMVLSAVLAILVGCILWVLFFPTLRLLPYLSYQRVGIENTIAPQDNTILATEQNTQNNDAGNSLSQNTSPRVPTNLPASSSSSAASTAATPVPTYARPQPSFGSSSSTATPTPAPDAAAPPVPAPAPTYTITTASSNLTIGVASGGGPDATCPEGSIILGGGFEATPGAKITQSYRVGEMWRVSASNSTSSPINVQAIARCAQGLPGFIGTYFESTTVAANSLATVSKSCPEGQTAISGGFDGYGLETHFSAKVGNGWRANAQNHTSTPRTLTVSVNCYFAGPVSLTPVLQAADIAAGDEGTKEASCSSGALIHGGFSFNSLVYSSYPAGSTWKNTGHNQTASSQRLRTYAYCATF